MFEKIKNYFNKSILNNSLKNDSILDSILKKEKNRQICSLELIASENFTSRAVLQANGTINRF